MQFLKQEYTVQERMNGFKKLQNTISIATSTNSKFFIGKYLKKKADNYKRYLTVRDKTYIDMHKDILDNNGKNACSFQEGLEVLDLLNKIYKFQ